MTKIDYFDKFKITEESVFVREYVNRFFNDVDDVYEITETKFTNVLQTIKSKLEKNTYVLRLKNSYDIRKDYTVPVANLLDLLISEKPIININGLLTKNQDRELSPINGVLMEFLSRRKSAKKQMLSYPKGSIEFTRFNTEQLVFKVLANSYYGASGQSSFVCYNPACARAVTANGQHIILSAILGFESYLGSSIKLLNFAELVDFIQKNLIDEKYAMNIMDKFDIDFELIEDVKVVERRLLSICKFKFSERELEFLRSKLAGMSDIQLTRLYYVNNIFTLIKDQSLFQEMFYTLMEKNIHELDHLLDDDEAKIYVEIIDLWTFSSKLFSDKVDRIHSVKRDVVLASDTDSTFLNIGIWIDFCTENLIEFEEDTPYDEIIPVINIALLILTYYIKKVFKILTLDQNMLPSFVHWIAMKNEFLYSRIVLTGLKKVYSGWLYSQEGQLVDDKSKLDMKGLMIKKKSTPAYTRNYFKEILIKDILTSKEINYNTIIEKVNEFENSIIDDLTVYRKTSFFKPERYSSPSNYKKPFTMRVVRGVLTFNALFPNEPIQKASKVRTVELTCKTLEQLKVIEEDYPDIYYTIKENVFDNDNLSPYGFNCIAFPYNMETFPEWLVPFISVEKIVLTNISPALQILKAIGIQIMKNKTNEYPSNFIEF
jgi:hypothetical protein